MFGISRPSQNNASSVVADRPELWVPAALLDVYREVASDVQISTTPLNSPEWVSYLRGDDPTQRDLGNAPKDATRGPLGSHVCRAVAEQKYGGVVPGSVPSPSSVVRYEQRPTPHTADRALKVLEWQVVPNDEDARRLYYWSVDAEPEFREEVSRVVSEVLSDTDRAWQAYVHLRAIAFAQREVEARADMARREEHERRVLQCPVCGQLNGSIARREVDPGHVPMRYPKGPMIRSCKPCWREACNQYQARRSAELLDGGESRAERIKRWLDTDVDQVSGNA